MLQTSGKGAVFVSKLAKDNQDFHVHWFDPGSSAGVKYLREAREAASRMGGWSQNDLEALWPPLACKAPFK